MRGITELPTDPAAIHDDHDVQAQTEVSVYIHRS
jgi:hypothetical protein